MTQGLLDFDAPPFVRGSDTSEAAAEEIKPSAGHLRGLVAAHISGRSDGATCDEVEAALGMRHQTASARIRELALSGAISDSGKRRLTRSRRGAVVWVGAAQ